MGSIDAESKKYLSINEIFADAFNFILFDGMQVILPEQLQPVDTAEIIVPYGNKAKNPVQRHRDTMKIWVAKEDGRAVYVLLGEEIQADIHYAMPVRNMLYDSITYAKQVDAARRSYRNQKDAGDVIYAEGQVKIRLTSEEFLSGFRKEDKLMPVITAVVYLGDKKWDGPLSLHEMLEIPDAHLLKAIPNYRINLIAPSDIGRGDFQKFHTDLGFALQVLKYQNDENIAEIILNTKHRKIDRSTAEFLNAAADLKLEYKDSEEEDIDMCKGMEDYTRRIMAEGKAEGKAEGEKSGIDMTRRENIKKIMKKLQYTASQAMDLLDIPAGERGKYM